MKKVEEKQGVDDGPGLKRRRSKVRAHKPDAKGRVSEGKVMKNALAFETPQVKEGMGAATRKFPAFCSSTLKAKEKKTKQYGGGRNRSRVISKPKSSRTTGEVSSVLRVAGK